jgi:hypothetical protein
MAKAAGSAIRRAIPRLLAAVGEIRSIAKAGGSATPKAIPKPPIRGWRSGEHGESGWFGDPEGHSEAARRGWEKGHRSQRRDEDDNGRYRSRSRYEDEDRRYESLRGGRYEDEDERSGGRGRGGWSGDFEGHSEAARRRLGAPPLTTVGSNRQGGWLEPPCLQPKGRR